MRSSTISAFERLSERMERHPGVYLMVVCGLSALITVVGLVVLFRAAWWVMAR